MTKLNYDFSVRNIEQTTLNHAKRISKLNYNKDILKGMIERMEERNEYEMTIVFSMSYPYSRRLMQEFRQNKTQKALKSLKNYANAETIRHIKYLLGLYNLPVSYYTAFYCIYYARINRLMKRNLKAIINY